MIRAFHNKTPHIGKNVYIADSAVIIGDVTLGDNVSVWENAVIRADAAPISIAEGSNVQDNCTLHTDIGFPVKIGSGVTIGHNAVIHGCEVENNVIVGMGAIVLNGAVIEERSIVGAGSLISQGKRIPKESIAMGNPFIIKRKAEEKDWAYITENAKEYVFLAGEYLKGK